MTTIPSPTATPSPIAAHVTRAHDRGYRAGLLAAADMVRSTSPELADRLERIAARYGRGA